jgi:peptidoglycan/xylan/chitin deacetylase (PgdA/CDA1 family)
MARFAKLLAAAAAGVAVAHAWPGVTALGPVRLRLLPALAGVGVSGHVALTFDDGPDRVATPQFLRLLEERGVQATFFLLGSMVQRSPELAREIADAGHEVGLHGYGHRSLLLQNPKSTMDDLARAYATVGGATGVAPHWYRPPYGVLSTAALIAAHRLDLRPVLWTAWGKDWTAYATEESVATTVYRGLRSGGTILLHDSDITTAPGAWRATLGVLPALLDHCEERGWSVGPLRDHGVAA